MFAIISYKGNQYKVTPGKEINLDLIDQSEGKIKFEEVLLASVDKKTYVGSPYIKDASVDGEIIGRKNGEKIESMKFHAKKRYKRTIGTRRDFTLVKILNLNLKNEK